jgi:hypothetical protein
LYCDGCIVLYVPDIIANKVGMKSRGNKILNWIYRAQYRAARNAEKRAALTVLSTIVSGNNKVFDRNVMAVFNQARV